MNTSIALTFLALLFSPLASHADSVDLETLRPLAQEALQEEFQTISAWRGVYARYNGQGQIEIYYGAETPEMGLVAVELTAEPLSTFHQLSPLGGGEFTPGDPHFIFFHLELPSDTPAPQIEEKVQQFTRQLNQVANQLNRGKSKKEVFVTIFDAETIVVQIMYGHQASSLIREAKRLAPQVSVEFDQVLHIPEETPSTIQLISPDETLRKLSHEQIRKVLGPPRSHGLCDFNF